MSLSQWMQTIYPLLLAKTLSKVEHTLDSGEKIKAYWVVDMIRIDIKPL